ncbi:nucleotidyltransferase domain-containing protein [bacterium]|nr:nucleotidyltransferase domain-containing protein [bacterium]
MRINKPLDKILNSEVKVKILRFLCRTEAEWNGRQIAKEIKITPATCHKALRELNFEQVLLLKNVGKSYLYRLNKENFLISALLKPLYEKENQLHREVYKAIIENINPIAKKNIVSIAVFGSIQVKKEQPTSDIDLLILVSDKKYKVQIEENFEKVNRNIFDKFGNVVSPYIQTTAEFKLKYKKGLPLIKKILRSHNLLFGKDLEGII